MVFNIDAINNLIKEFNVDAVIATQSSTFKYLGYDLWFNNFEDWMLKPGGSGYGVSGSLCIIGQNEKPVFIIPSSFASFLPDIDNDSIYVYDYFFDSVNPDGKINIDNEKDLKLAAILKNNIFKDYLEALNYVLKKKFKSGNIFAVEGGQEITRLIEDINKTIPGFEFKRTEEIFRLARMIKSKQEIELIKKCLKISEDALLKSIDFIRPEINFNKAGSCFKEYLLAANAQFAYYTIFPRGLGVVDYKNYIVEKNSVFGLDVGAAYENYVSDTGLTVFFGNVSNMDYDNYKKCLSVLEAGYRSIKPGVYCSDIFKAMNMTVSGLKLDNILYEGHGIGLSFREYPVINGCLDYFYDDGFFSRNADFVLQENMVFNLEVSWFCFYQKSIQIEKTFFVTKNGCQELDFQQRNEPVVI